MLVERSALGVRQALGAGIPRLTYTIIVWSYAPYKTQQPYFEVPGYPGTRGYTRLGAEAKPGTAAAIVGPILVPGYPVVVLPGEVTLSASSSTDSGTDKIAPAAFLTAKTRVCQHSAVLCLGILPRVPGVPPGYPGYPGGHRQVEDNLMQPFIRHIRRNS
eukprot:1711280-Rhodomonas_salina.1